MSGLLLDTHVWLWSLGDPDRLSSTVRAAIVDAPEVVLSVASVWEVGIKHAMGKLALPGGPRPLVDEAVRALHARVLPIGVDHVLEAARLPMYHRDPFDRLLVAQCRVEGLTLVTVDEALRPYEVALLWAAV